MANHTKTEMLDTEDINRPEKLVEDFALMNEPFTYYKFMFDHLAELMGSSFFNDFTEKGLLEFCNHYFHIAETIFQIEKHAEDRSIRWHIKAFAEHVIQKSPQEVEELGRIMDSMVKEYGSLKNGIHHRRLR